jgi:hypothetical protein
MTPVVGSTHILSCLSPPPPFSLSAPRPARTATAPPAAEPKPMHQYSGLDQGWNTGARSVYIEVKLGLFRRVKQREKQGSGEGVPGW